DDYQRYLLDEAKRQRELAKTEAAAQERPAAKAAAPQPVAKQPVPSAQAAAQPAKAPTDAKDQRKQDAQVRQQLADKARPLKKELEQIDQRIAALVAERAALEHKLAQPLAPSDIAEGGRRLKAAADETAHLEERWLEVSGALEELSAAVAG
ncbi:MAG: ABC transporter, partial [Burkholderiaceae bacterium]|nr:ABC transporter [Burkholderiaceae bacterium]